MLKERKLLEKSIYSVYPKYKNKKIVGWFNIEGYTGNVYMEIEENAKHK